MKKIIVVALVLFVLAGCTSAPRGYGRFRGNMTEEQRQQMMEQMTQACQGLAEGNPCIMQSPRGQRNGTCELQNSTLVCRGMRGNYTGRAPPQ